MKKVDLYDISFVEISFHVIQYHIIGHKTVNLKKKRKKLQKKTDTFKRKKVGKNFLQIKIRNKKGNS